MERLTKGRNEVGVIMAKISDRLVAVKLVMGEELVVVISANGPQTGCEEGEKRGSWRN